MDKRIGGIYITLLSNQEIQYLGIQNDIFYRIELLKKMEWDIGGYCVDTEAKQSAKLFYQLLK